jgi:hypothetical protein
MVVHIIIQGGVGGLKGSMTEISTWQSPAADEREVMTLALANFQVIIPPPPLPPGKAAGVTTNNY